MRLQGHWLRLLCKTPARCYGRRIAAGNGTARSLMLYALAGTHTEMHAISTSAYTHALYGSGLCRPLVVRLLVFSFPPFHSSAVVCVGLHTLAA